MKTIKSVEPAGYRRGGVLAAALLLLIIAGACQQNARLTDGQLAGDKGATVGPDRAREVLAEDFLDDLAGRPKCTVAHACRGIAMLIAGKDIAGPFSARYQYLLDRDIVRPAWNLREDQWIDRGTLAYMLYKGLKIRGGVNMCLFASWGLGDRHYAYREMLYHQLIQSGVDYGYVSGPELLTALGKADRYMEDHGQYSPERKIQLGKKPQT